ncbi:MAG: TRAP transporter small permease [Rhodoferax sp.]|nr:TRAP transporter small permease [Rhodoferax sp.]MCB2008429.1 TRAP transporter small permease [Rhodoferax sp.]MCB2029618.1 TRAP transporter small permease [Rhodoferax sp.]MCB2039477.1 TRAP transporter small permease [Rhodoferax sp.]MCP5263593.1 TRAP transporter small permease [Rhodoferax sp.]
MRRVLHHAYAASLFLAGLFLVGIFVLMIGESAFRKLGSYIVGANELIGWFCAAAGFLALPATFIRGDMVRVGFIVDHLAPGMRKVVLTACLLLALVFVSYMLYAISGYMLSSWRYGDMTQGMIEVAVWIPKTSFLLGVALLWVAIVDALVTTLAARADSLRAERLADTEAAPRH